MTSEPITLVIGLTLFALCFAIARFTRPNPRHDASDNRTQHQRMIDGARGIVCRDGCTCKGASITDAPFSRGRDAGRGRVNHGGQIDQRGRHDHA